MGSMQQMLLGTSASGGGGGSPATGYNGWYRGDSYAAGTWTDKSVNGFNLTGTTLTSPTATASDANFNNQPVVTFNGTTDDISNSGNVKCTQLMSNAAFTSYFVLRPTALGIGNNPNGTALNWIYSNGGGNYMGGIGNTAICARIQDNGGANLVPLSGSVATNTLYGVRFRWDNTTAYLKVSGQTEGTASGTGPQLWNNSDIPVIGFNTGSLFFQGALAEMIFYSTFLSGTDRTTTENYLASRYNFTW